MVGGKFTHLSHKAVQHVIQVLVYLQRSLCIRVTQRK